MSQTQVSQEAMRAEWEKLNKETEGVIPEGVAPVVGEENLESTNTDKQDVVEPQTPISETPEVQEIVPPKPKDSENFRRLREQNRELERKMAELEANIKEAKKPEQTEEIEDYELKDDDLTEGKHYKLLNKKVKTLNEALQKERIERDKLAIEARLRANYPDIFNVVTKDNMEELAAVEPDLVDSIVSSPNTYAQHVSAYKLIKKYGIGTQDPYADDKARAQKNMAKPKSAATVAPRQGESPLSDADRFSRGLTQELQNQLLREMDEAIANRN
jgi:hypothetical protein